jgi:hypothetical protein
MLSVHGANRYYMFLVVERIQRRVPSMTYQKYVMDPMFPHQ